MKTAKVASTAAEKIESVPSGRRREYAKAYWSWLRDGGDEPNGAEVNGAAKIRAMLGRTWALLPKAERNKPSVKAAPKKKTAAKFVSPAQLAKLKAGATLLSLAPSAPSFGLPKKQESEGAKELRATLGVLNQLAAKHGTFRLRRSGINWTLHFTRRYGWKQEEIAAANLTAPAMLQRLVGIRFTFTTAGIGK